MLDGSPSPDWLPTAPCFGAGHLSVSESCQTSVKRSLSSDDHARHKRMLAAQSVIWITAQNEWVDIVKGWYRQGPPWAVRGNHISAPPTGRCWRQQRGEEAIPPCHRRGGGHFRLPAAASGVRRLCKYPLKAPVSRRRSRLLESSTAGSLAAVLPRFTSCLTATLGAPAGVVATLPPAPNRGKPTGIDSRTGPGQGRQPAVKRRERRQ